MAKSKKTQKKGSSKKVSKLVRSDVVKSVAIASVLLNVLFFATILVLSSTNTFDRRLYTSVHSKYCQNSSALSERSKELGNAGEALNERQVDCIGKDFAPFYKEALDKYKASAEQ